MFFLRSNLLNNWFGVECPEEKILPVDYFKLSRGCCFNDHSGFVLRKKIEKKTSENSNLKFNYGEPSN